MNEYDYVKRIADYQAATDEAALQWRSSVLQMDEKAQKKAFFRFAEISTAVPDSNRRWILITSARIEKTKGG